MLLELAIGDAYGAGFEFKESEYVSHHNVLTGYLPHGLGMDPGSYTDDTQMTIALMELMLSGSAWTYGNVADAFLSVYKRDRRLGYSEGFQQLLDSVEDGWQLLQKIRPCSARNGAAMRSVPLGVLDVETLREYSRIHTAITHNSESGFLSAEASALIAHFFAHGVGVPSQLVEFVSDISRFHWEGKCTGPVPCEGMQTVEAVLSVLSIARSQTEILQLSVALEGDTDSVAAIALGAASFSPEHFLPDLPAWSFDELEHGEFGRPFLERLDRKFQKRFLNS